MLGVHLDVEFEADSALPRLHHAGKLNSADFSLTECLLLGDLTRMEVEGAEGGHGEPSCHIHWSLHGTCGDSTEHHRSQECQSLHFLLLQFEKVWVY